MSTLNTSNATHLLKNSISCFNVPDSLLDKTCAKFYFQQFGRLIRIRLRPKQKVCIVEYANAKDAEIAFSKSGNYNDTTFKVSWTKQKSIDKKVVRKKPQNKDWSFDKDVQSELDAMKGNFSYKEPSKNLKTRQWKSEKSKTKKPENVTSVTQPQPNMEQKSELLKVIMTTALTNEDKFRVLDARDKLLRSRLAGHRELARATRAVGTCPDMCPEKERLLRQVQHQIAGFEQMKDAEGRGDLDHSLAVKQYSRSSADQEAALEHELRPVNVLRRTMLHLLRLLDIADSQEVNLGEWYHFLWDRTRAIRKDITQQELCCLQSVELVEQCARFHIHCAARLVAEDAAVFDAKINSENLTKCLQTLKYMYQDLRVQHQVLCPHEAEFRGYIVLLNLHDGNFMWEVQHLTRQIQRSAEVQFALKVFIALDNNNFVRFFKLVASTTYLNACILLRYFHWVRQRALRVLLKVQPPRGATLSLEELTNMLGFEDVTAAAAFVEANGLELTPEGDQVHLDRRRLSPLVGPPVMQRARRFVEAKRIVAVSETVCGAPLPASPPELHIPHDSFDQDGHLKISELPEEFHEKYSQYLDQFQQEQDQTQEMDEGSNDGITEIDGDISPMFTIEPIKTSEENKNQSSLFDSVKTPNDQIQLFWSKPIILPTNNNSKINETNQKINSQPMFNILTHSFTTPNIPQFEFSKPLVNEIKFTVTESIFKSTPPTIFKPIAPVITATKSESDQEKLLEKERKMKEMLLQKQIKLELEEKRKVEEQRRLKELRIKEELLKKEKAAKANTKLKQEVTLVLNSLLNKVEEQLVKKRLEEISNNIKNRKALMYAKRWWYYTNISKKKRKNFFDNPVWNYSRSTSIEARELFTPSQNLTLHDIKRYKRGVAQSITLPEFDKNPSLDIFSLVWKILFEKLCTDQYFLKTNNFWKVAVSLPDKIEAKNDFKCLKSLMQNALEWQESTNKFSVTKRFYSNNGGSLTYCIKEITKSDNNINGLLFIITNNSTELTYKRFINDFVKKQINLPIPIVVIVKDYNSEVVQQLKLNQLKNQQIISDFDVLYCSEKNFNSTLGNSLKFLASNVVPLPNLEMDSLPVFLRNCIGEEFWHRLHSSSIQNKKLEVLLREPNIVIKLYNELLQKTLDIIFDEDLRDIPNFPNEFKQFIEKEHVLLPCTYEYFTDDWNSIKYLNKIRKIVETLYLPEFKSNWPPNNERDLHEVLEEYFLKIFKDPAKILLKILNILLNDINSNEDFKEKINVITWCEIVQVIILEKIVTYEFADKTHPVYTVAYRNDKLKELWQLPWWYNSEVIKTRIDSVEVEYFNEPEIQIEETNDESEEIDIDKTIAELQINDEDNIEEQRRMQNEIKELSSLLDDLEESMSIQKKIMKTFQSKIVNSK